MRKTASKLLALLLMVYVFIPSTTVFAVESKTDNQNTPLYLIEEQQYVDEYGELVTERLYSNVNPFLRGASGSGTFKKELETTYDTINITYWVEGYFTWNEDNDTVTVSNVKSGHSSLGSIRISNEETTSESNAGFSALLGIFRKYAYAKYSFTLKNIAGITRDLSVEVKVHNNGK